MAKIKEVIAAANTHNLLAAGTQIKGDIIAEEDFRIDGAIEGNINCKRKIIVGVNSSITGNVECANIELLGRIQGNIVCTETVILRSTSILTGDIKTGTIEIEPEARFDGSCSMHKK